MGLFEQKKNSKLLLHSSADFTFVCAGYGMFPKILNEKKAILKQESVLVCNKNSISG